MMTAVRSRSLKAIGNTIKSCNMKEADKLWIKGIQKEFVDKIKI